MRLTWTGFIGWLLMTGMLLVQLRDLWYRVKWTWMMKWRNEMLTKFAMKLAAWIGAAAVAQWIGRDIALRIQSLGSLLSHAR